MSQRIWIVRHGNREDFQNPGWARSAERPFDPALSPDGEIQAQELGRSLRDGPNISTERARTIDRIFASPFLRTIQTAAHIADALGLPIYAEPGLGEILPTGQERPAFLSERERAQRFPRINENYSPVAKLSYPEEAGDGYKRAVAAVQALTVRYPNENLLLVTHAAPVVGIVRGLTGLQDPIKVPLCSIFTLQRNGSSWEILQQADVSHLSDPWTSRRYAHIG